jgi:ATP-dependent DNA ligase
MAKSFLRTPNPRFSALQDDLKRKRYDRMVYYAFDLLHLDGFDTRAAPLVERKRVLQSFCLKQPQHPRSSST